VREARGNNPRLELRGERLLALQKQERLLSQTPVEITRARDVFVASTLDFDLKSGLYELDGRVRGVLQPRQP